MIKATKFIFDFNREFARFNTSNSKNLSLIDKIAIINKAQDIYVSHGAELFEVNEKYRTILRPLEQKEVSLDIDTQADKFIIASFPDDKIKMTRQRAICRKGGLTKEIPITLVQADDLDLANINTNWRSDFAWEQIVGDEGAKGLYVWHYGEFEIEDVVIDYIRRPQEIHAPSLLKGKESYIDWNGVERTEDQDCELTERFSDNILIDIAVAIADSTVNDTGDYQLKIKEILETRQIASA